MYDEIPRRENFLSFSAKTFFLQKTWHHLSTWDAPHIWLHHGVHLLADMKAAISDNIHAFQKIINSILFEDGQP